VRQLQPERATSTAKQERRARPSFMAHLCTCYGPPAGKFPEEPLSTPGVRLLRLLELKVPAQDDLRPSRCDGSGGKAASPAVRPWGSSSSSTSRSFLTGSAPWARSRPIVTRRYNLDHEENLTAVSVLAVTILLTFPVSADSYGKPLSPAQPVKVSELIANPDTYVGKVVKVEASSPMCAPSAVAGWCSPATRSSRRFGSRSTTASSSFPWRRRERERWPRDLHEDGAHEGAEPRVPEAPGRGDETPVRPQERDGGLTIYQIKGVGASIQ